MEFLTQNLIYLVPLFGITGLFFMYIKSSWIKKQNTGKRAENDPNKTRTRPENES